MDGRGIRNGRMKKGEFGCGEPPTPPQKKPIRIIIQELVPLPILDPDPSGGGEEEEADEDDGVI